MKDWHVGMKVVCVGSEPNWDRTYEAYPKVGGIYTIRNVFISPRTGDVGIRLAEVVNHERPGFHVDTNGSSEFGFRASRFRPVQERKTDIGIFTAMLRNQTQNLTPEGELAWTPHHVATQGKPPSRSAIRRSMN